MAAEGRVVMVIRTLEREPGRRNVSQIRKGGNGNTYMPIA